ncbi:odorant receptor 10-like [Euwallacea similis]|uniref:odorant receptor 10-like n=1 Tax=Euwallacea similis TaxID=1736056 RepID=UPI00344E30C7
MLPQDDVVGHLHCLEASVNFEDGDSSNPKDVRWAICPVTVQAKAVFPIVLLPADVSDPATSAILSQGKISHELPIAYASRSLNKSESNYSTIEKELLAIIGAVKQKRILKCAFREKFTAYIELYLILNENPIKKDHMSLNLCVTLIRIVIFCKRLITQISPSFKKMIKTIIEDEMKGDLIDDELIQKFERENIENVNWKCKIYIYCVIIVSLINFTKPIIVGPVEETYSNATKIVRELPLSSWFPFNVQEHYKAAYTFQVIDGIVGSNSIVVIDILMISLILYPCRQLKKLDHLLRNFQDFKRKYQNLNAIEDEEEAFFLFFKHLIVRHENIIQYVNIYNKNMAFPMLLDFIQSSIQIAKSLTQVSGNEITLLLIACISMFSLSMLLRLCLYYYHADELLILSQKLTHSIWESNWPDETPKIKFMILIFIMRVQKPLVFTIGPFGVMSIESFISILKGTYSYVMLIMT